MAKWIVVLSALLAVGCGSGPKAEGKALAKEFCAAVNDSSGDPMKAMSLGANWATKSQSAAQKYASEPSKMQEFLAGYQEGTADCKR